MDPEDPFPEPVEIEITDVFDLHTIAPRDVKRVVEEYLELAREKGFRVVRIIHALISLWTGPTLHRKQAAWEQLSSG